MSNVAKTERAASVAAPPNSRAVALQVLGAESNLLSIIQASSEASEGYQRARNLPNNMPVDQQARHCLELLPPEPQLRRLSEAWQSALAEPPDDRKNRVLLGLLFDTYPSAVAGQPETFIEAALCDLKALAFPPIVVAEALQALRRTRKFRPAIAEILEECARVKQDRARWPRYVEGMAEQRNRAVKTLQQLAATE